MRRTRTRPPGPAPASSPLQSFRGSNPVSPLSARGIIASLEVPGCSRRTGFDYAGINLDRIAPILGCPPGGQAQHAFSRGNSFEDRVMANGAADLIALLREHFGMDIRRVRFVDLSAAAVRSAYPGPVPDINALRAKRTRQELARMLNGRSGGAVLLRHAMTTLPVGSREAYLEQDALALVHDGVIHIVEIKSFPKLDGRADPAKADGARRQSAAYGLSLIYTVDHHLKMPASVVSPVVLLILPENFGLTPTGTKVDISIPMRRLRKQLAARPTDADLAAALPAGASLPPLPKYIATEDPDKRAANDAELAAARPAVETAFRALPPRFGDNCLNCPTFAYCRDEAVREGAIGQLGSAVANACGSVTSIDTALALAAGTRTPDNEAEAALAEHLARAAAVRNRRVS